MSGYDKSNVQRTDSEEHYKRTLKRIQKIQSHLVESPRSGKLKDKVCVVTGVGSLKGIGRASALLFAHEGAKHLYCIDFSAENLPNLKATIEKKYTDVKITTIQADAADEKAISAVCHQAINEEGQLDVFFANAGISIFSTLEDGKAEDFMETMRINALSCYLAVKHASAAMRKTSATNQNALGGGSIVITASVAGIRSGAGSIDYSASKAAAMSIAQSSANQLQKTGIRVNAICPGLIETGMTTATFDFARQRGTAGKVGHLNPLGRYGVAEEVAQVALFLASDDSSYVNGQCWAVDGGLSSSHPVAPGRFV